MNALFQNTETENTERVRVRAAAEGRRPPNNPLRSDLIKSFVHRSPGERKDLTANEVDVVRRALRLWGGSRVGLAELSLLSPRDDGP